MIQRVYLDLMHFQGDYLVFLYILVHYKFFEAGADAIETLSYKLSGELIGVCYEKGWLNQMRDAIISSGLLTLN